MADLSKHDDKSFHRGMVIGMRTALAVLADRPADPSGIIRQHIADLKEAMETLYPGSNREMRASDIFLEMPVMLAADIGI